MKKRIYKAFRYKFRIMIMQAENKINEAIRKYGKKIDEKNNLKKRIYKAFRYKLRITACSEALLYCWFNIKTHIT